MFFNNILAIAQRFMNSKFLPIFYGLLTIFIFAIIIAITKINGYGLTYQATASMPRGFYLLLPINKIQRGDIVTFIPPEKSRAFLKERHWAPRSGILMKYVVGMPGDTVCAENNKLWLNHKPIANIYKFYAPNKALPQQNFCGELNKEQYFLININIPHSFDSRYFGPIDKKSILHRAIQ